MNTSRKSVKLMVLNASLTVFSMAVCARAAVVTVSGTYTGTPGTGSSGFGNQYFGNGGGDGYDTGTTSSTFQFSNAVITGGTGASIAGTDSPTSPTNEYEAGPGGNGATVYSAATFSSGTYSGGAGGTVTGSGLATYGGGGGNAATIGYFGDSSPTLAVAILGGSFTGGNGGASLATAPDGDGTGYGGSGLQTDYGTAMISGGSFTGGSGNSQGGSGSGVLDDGGTVNIYGGSFSAGANVAPGFDFGIDAIAGTVTVFGSDFTVNGVPVGSGPITGSGTITGTLENNGGGSSITYALQGGTINLEIASVPEPTSLSLLLIGGLASRRRRRNGHSAVNC